MIKLKLMQNMLRRGHVTWTMILNLRSVNKSLWSFLHSREPVVMEFMHAIMGQSFGSKHEFFYKSLKW